MKCRDPFARKDEENDIHLRLLSTTDLHGEVMAYDYFADRPEDGHGLVRTASLIRAARADVTNTLLVDAGDFLQGSPPGDIWAKEPERLNAGPHPVIAAMNAIGIEASTLGNHDFNYGLPFLEESLKGTAFPVVNANVVRGTLAEDPRDDTYLVPPHAILERSYITRGGETVNLRIGVIGFCPPQIMSWDAQLLTGKVDARDVVEAARAMVPDLRAKGADIVIALSHGGVNTAPHTPGMEQAALYIAGVEGVDVIVCGHQHLTFPGSDIASCDQVDAQAGTLMGKPAVMASCFGARMGVIDLKLRRSDDGWKVICHDSRTWPIARREGGTSIALVSDDPEIRALAAPVHAETLDYVRRPVGETARPITTYFSLVANDVSLQVVAHAQAELARDALKGTEWDGLPMLSVSSPFKAGGSGGPRYYTRIDPGPIARKDIADLYLYPNTLCALDVTGAQVREWLEGSAGLFNRIAPGAADVQLLDPSYQTYNYDVVYGLEYRIDLSQPRRYSQEGKLIAPQARRITQMRHQGQPVQDDDRFVVITNSYRAGGGGLFPGAQHWRKVWQSPQTARDALHDFVAQAGCLDLTPRHEWGFAPVPGASVLYPCAPEAVQYLPQDGPSISLAGAGPDGFAYYRIAL